MNFLFNARTNEKIILNKDVYSIGTFSDSDTKLNCLGSIQIIIKKKKGQVILYKGCGKFQVNRKHTLKKVLEDNDEIFIGKEVFVFSLSEEFDLRKSQIIYNSYLGSMESLKIEPDSTYDIQPARKPESQVYMKSAKKPESEHFLEPVIKPESQYDFPLARKPENQYETKPVRKPESQYDLQSVKKYDSQYDSSSNWQFDQLLALNDSFTKQLSSVLEFDTLLPIVTDIALKNINADKALLMLYDEDPEQLSVKTSVNFHNSIDELDQMNQKLASEIISGLKTNSVFLNSVSIEGMNFIDSIIIAKLSANDTVFGYLCLINKIFDEFNNNDKYIIELLANQTSMAIDRINLYAKARNEEEVIGKLKRYLPTKTINRLIKTNASLDMNGELEVCTILFVDICNFSAITESLNPKQLVAFLNEYFTIMSKIIMSYNGNVNKFIGDGLMAVFGAPGKTPNHALGATLAALEIKKQKTDLSQKFFEKYNMNNFNIRIGINTGLAVYGNIGSLQRMDFTVIGDNVNIASQLEENAPIGGILISQSTYENIYKKVKVTPSKKIKLRGKSDLIEAYLLIDIIEDDLVMQQSIPGNIDYSVRENMRVAVKAMAIIIKNGKEVQALLRDVGVGGVCLSLNMSGNYKVDDEIILNFKLNEQYNFKNINGTIKHLKKVNSANNSNNRLIMGIMFNNLTDEDSQLLTNYIENKSTTWLELPIV